MKSLPVIRRILRYAKPYRGYIIGALLFAVANVSLTLYAPVLIGQAVDQIIGPGQVDFSSIGRILLLLSTVIVGASIFSWMMTRCTNVVTYRTVRDIRVALFDKLQQVPLKTIDAHAHGDLISRVVNDVDQISDGLLQGFSQLFTGVVTIVGTFAFMLSINLTITLVVVVLTPLSLFVASFIAKHSYEMFRRQSELRGELGGYIEEMVGNQKVVKAFTREQRAQEEFEAINRELYHVGFRAQFYSSISNPGTRFVNGIVYAAVGLTGALSVISGRLSIGQLSCFLSYANQYTKPFNEISGVVTELQTATASARRVFEMLDQPSEPPEPDAAVMTHSEGLVEAENVSFSYTPARPLIDGFHLTAQPGQRIAIVGPTGCGKTTLINLLMRFYEIDGGRIRVDGIDIGSVTRDSLRAQYGMVLQDTWLFVGTIRDNIAYGKPDATDEEVIAAAKAAHAHSFIKRLERGYDTVISEEGSNLSQGQRQLLSIARIMLTHPPMLILDEATSSIDTRTEIKIQKAFDRMMEGRTSFIVAHRLSTIREADRILVMREGKIVEQGTHEALLQKNGFYAELYNSQFVQTTDE